MQKETNQTHEQDTKNLHDNLEVFRLSSQLINSEVPRFGALLRGTQYSGPNLVSQNSVLYRFLWISWVLITMVLRIRVFATYLIMSGWKTCKQWYENDEPPNPRPTQPKKNQVKSGVWATFSHSKQFLVGWDRLHIGKRLQEIQPSQILRKHPFYFFFA